ncbi:hypothetical protein TKK_0017505 [Trichogramma kaykai]
MLKTIVFSLVLAVLFIETAKNKSHATPYYYFFEYSPCGIMLSNWVTEQEKYIIVQLHNELRQKVARGEEQRGNPGPQPPALAMPNLEWDTELEAAAQQWANGCLFEHDPCNHVGRYSFGQNLGLEATTGNAKSLKLEQAVRRWYDEVKYFDKRNVQSYRHSPKYGHYSQLVWAETNKIGCGVTRYQEKGYKKLYLVCNYGPAGNTRNFPVYKSHK